MTLLVLCGDLSGPVLWTCEWRFDWCSLFLSSGLLVTDQWEDAVDPEEAVEAGDVASIAATALTLEESVNLTDTVAATDRKYISVP